MARQMLTAVGANARETGQVRDAINVVSSVRMEYPITRVLDVFAKMSGLGRNVTNAH